MNMIKVMDGFVKDENGKFHIIPMKAMTTVSSPSKNSAEKRSVIRRKFIPIERLVLTPADFGESPQNEKKKRKIERTVCKELFKVPQRKPEKRLSGTARSRFSAGRNFNSHNTKSDFVKKINGVAKKQQISASSPLLEMDEAEGFTSNKINTVLFPMGPAEEAPVVNKATPPKTSFDEKELTPKTRESIESDLEFLQLEKRLASAKKIIKSETASPLTSVCALLQNTKITNSSEKTPKSQKKLNEVLALVQEDLSEMDSLNQQFESLNQQFENFKKAHKTRLTKIVDLLGRGEDKENKNRRSIRLASQKKFVISPAISSKVDLRKSTLNKNLSKNLESPRMKKAVDMYNTMRSDCTVLCTPKTDRSNLDCPQTSVTRSLSRRIQQQCLLLQDTPRPT